MKEFITWNNFNDSVCLLANNIKKDLSVEDYDIVGISRGGWILAATLAYQLKIRKVYSIGIQSYSHDDKQEKITSYQHLNLGNIKQNILVVDDISDTGDTFQYIDKTLVNKNIKTVSLAVKDKTSFWPDYSAFAFKSNIWVVFPWDN